MAEKSLRIRKIKQGTVIDHVNPGKALIVLRLLGISESPSELITIAMNIPSSKLGKKDIIKIENRFLSEEDFNTISLISPKASINKIQDYNIIKKDIVQTPDRFTGIIACINPTCITNKENEPISSKFIVLEKNPLKIKCEYCGRIMDQPEVTSHFISK